MAVGLKAFFLRVYSVLPDPYSPLAWAFFLSFQVPGQRTPPAFHFWLSALVFVEKKLMYGSY